jgi:hypothetical protein
MRDYVARGNYGQRTTMANMDTFRVECARYGRTTIPAQQASVKGIVSCGIVNDRNADVNNVLMKHRFSCELNNNRKGS